MRSSGKHALVVAISMLGVLSCSKPAEPARENQSALDPDRTAPIQTDSTSYLLVREERGWRADIPFRFRNVATDTIYIVNCNGAFSVALEQKAAQGWRPFWSPIINGCFSPPLTVAPGDTRSVPWIVWGAAPGGNVGPAFADTTFDGVYRFVWQNVLFNYEPQRESLGDTVPLRFRVSNEFALQVKR